MKLTNTAIDALQPGQLIRDDSIPGLHVKALAGRKSFYLYFRTKAGVERRPKLGEWGILTVAQGRAIAREMLAEVAAGRDPVAERQRLRQEPSINDLWDRCEKDIWNRGKRWDEEAKRIYEGYIKPRIGAVRVRDLRYPEIDAIRAALHKTPNQANRTIAVVSKMLNHAERLEWREMGSNPCQQIERYSEAKRRRFASPDEIAKIGPQLEARAKEKPAAVAFLYLLIFSGARPSEIARATWEQIHWREDGTAVLRIPEGKTGHRDVFLPNQAVKVLLALPRDPKQTITGLADTPKKVWKAVRKAAGCSDLWARDLRRTFATVGFSGGVPIGMVGELLGHKSTQTTKVYARLMEDPALAAAGVIATKLETMLAG